MKREKLQCEKSNSVPFFLEKARKEKQKGERTWGIRK